MALACGPVFCKQEECVRAEDKQKEDKKQVQVKVINMRERMMQDNAGEEKRINVEDWEQSGMETTRYKSNQVIQSN